VPFVDANQHLASFDAAGFDQTVIGAGAAGIMLALELARQGQRVLLIESGHFKPDDDRQALNEIEETGKRLGDAVWTRKRIIGGTTTAWGGQSLPFSPIDFAARDWVEGSGWPIGYETLWPYYARANAFMGVDTLNYDTDIDRRLRQPAPPFDREVIYHHYSKWAPEPNFLKRHGRRLKTAVTLLYNAELTRLELADGRRVSGVEIANFRGERRALPARTVALAAGGIETNRILLLNGLGGQGGWLGRGFMEHPGVNAGEIETADMFRLQSWLGTRWLAGRRVSAKLSASARWQRENRLLNVSSGVMWLYEGGEIGPLAELGAFLRAPHPRRLLKALGQAGRLSQGLAALVARGVVYKPGVTPVLGLVGEQPPSQDSYIALSDETDRFGRRKARLNWRVSPQTWESMVRFAQLIAEELPRAGLGRVKLYPHIRLDEPNWEAQLTDVNHHMGGARMSAAPADGVVDPDLRVWGVDNLYACSGAVFPTGSHSNPTLTLLALAARLADTLAAG
jgi:choline dehydrogenase-like flavoprotein